MKLTRYRIRGNKLLILGDESLRKFSLSYNTVSLFQILLSSPMGRRSIKIGAILYELLAYNVEHHDRSENVQTDLARKNGLM